MQQRAHIRNWTGLRTAAVSSTVETWKLLSWIEASKRNHYIAARRSSSRPCASI